MQPQKPPKPSFRCAIFHKLSPLRTVTVESEGAVGATGAVAAILIGVPGTICSGWTMPGLMAASSCQRWPSPKFICASFHNESPYFTMTLRGPAAFEIAGAAGAGCVVGATPRGQYATSPSSGVEISSAFANSGAIGASCTAGTSVFGFETANLEFTAIAREVEEVESIRVAGVRLGTGVGAIGFGSTNRVFNVGVPSSAFGNTGAVGALRGVASTTFGSGIVNSGFAEARTAFATGRWYSASSPVCE